MPIRGDFDVQPLLDHARQGLQRHADRIRAFLLQPRVSDRQDVDLCRTLFDGGRDRRHVGHAAIDQLAPPDRDRRKHSRDGRARQQRRHRGP